MSSAQSKESTKVPIYFICICTISDCHEKMKYLGTYTIHCEIIFHSLNFRAKNAALTKKRSARVTKIYEAKKLEISGILCGETNFIRRGENISMIINQ